MHYGGGEVFAFLYRGTASKEYESLNFARLGSFLI